MIVNKHVFDDGSGSNYYKDCPGSGLNDNWEISYHTDNKLLMLSKYEFIKIPFRDQSIDDTSFYRIYIEDSYVPIKKNHYPVEIGDKKYDCVKETWYLNQQHNVYHVYRAKDVGIVKIYEYNQRYFYPIS